MQANRIASAIAIATVLVGGALVLRARAPSEAPPPAAPATEPLTIAVGDTPAPRAAPTPARDAAAVAKIRELEAMSESFRNTSFLIAIRDAGYTCRDLLRVYGGIDDSGKWTATCSEMLAYTVGVTSNGVLRVDPLLQYFDAQGPVRIDQSGPLPLPSDRPFRDSLPPETR